MAFHTKKEFAELCGLSTGNLGNYITGKGRKVEVVMSGDVIDDSIPMNALFLAKRAGRAATKSATEVPHIQAPVMPATKKVEIKAPAANASEYSKLDLEKIQLENEKKRIDIELAKARLAKQNGESIPMDAAKTIVAIQQRSSANRWKNSVEMFLIIWAKFFNLTPEQTAEIRRKQLDEINIAINDSADEAYKSLKKLAEEFSDTKEVGEKE